MQFQKVTVSNACGDGIEGISNPALQSAQESDPAMSHQQLMADDHLDQVRQKLDKVSAESVCANETVGTSLVTDTEVAGSEALAALL
jgi:hypothetical protein